MKLKKLLIMNFRNYSGETVFDLSKDITILYGENGNGKSSFFDAIEWCVTGEIKRFAPIEKNKNIIANSSMELNDDCMVCLYFDDYVLKRSFKKIGDIEFSYLKVSIKNIRTCEIVNGETNVVQKLDEIVSNGSKNKWDKRAMSQAYILSQSQINSFITKDKPKDRYDSLASIMGFDKINNVKKNIDKFINGFHTKNSLNERELTRVINNIDTLESEFTFKLEKYNLNQEEVNKYSNIEELSKELSEIKSNYLDMISDKNKVENNGNLFYGNPELLSNLIEESEKNINKINNNINEKIQRKLKEEENINQLIKDHAQLTKEIKLVKNKEIKVDKLQNLTSDFTKLLKKNEVSDFEYVPYYLKEALDKKSKLDYRSQNLSKVKSWQEEIEKVNEQIALINHKNEVLTIQILTYEEQNQILLKEFSDGKVANDIQKLLSLVEDTNSYTKEKEEFENTCPICDSKVENLGEFLNSKAKKLIEDSGKYKKRITVNINQRKEIEEKISILKNDKETNLINLKLIETQKENNKNKILEIKNSYLFDQDIFFKNNELLSNMEANLDIRIKELTDLKEIKQELDKIKKELLLPTDITLLEKNITPEEISARIEKSEILVNSINHEIEKEIVMLEQEKVKKKESFDKKVLLEDLFKKYLIDENTNLQNYFAIKLDELSVKEKYLENSLRKSNVINELKNIQKEVSKINISKAKFEEEKKYFENIIEKLEQKKIIIKDNFGNQTEEFLNNPRSSIIRYYQYLNPNPVEFQEIFFDVKNNNELDIKVKNENNSIIANYILSSGQLNVLAISIFIATNMSQSFSFFDFIAIDDPIQNMDDVNRFSITDVLSNLERQLIFSTHDIDYLNLFIKKNEHKIENISVYNLDSEKNSYKNILISEIAPQKK